MAWHFESDRHSMSAKGISTGRKKGNSGKVALGRLEAELKLEREQEKKKKRKPKKKNLTERTQDILNKKTLSEKEVLLVKNRLNAGKVEIEDLNIKGDWDLTSEQEKKGLAWLKNQWKSPTGKERITNPFANREKSAIDSFQRFKLVGFYDRGNMYFKNYFPVYAVLGKNGSFKYYVQGGKINIIG